MNKQVKADKSCHARSYTTELKMRGCGVSVKSWNAIKKKITLI